MIIINNDYIEFLNLGAVVNVSSEEEYYRFSNLMKKLGLLEISYFDKMVKKHGSYESAVCYDCGIKKYNLEDICIEYQMGKGFTTAGKEEYFKWDEDIIILSVTDLERATGYYMEDMEQEL